MSEITITDLVVPERLDSPDAAGFHAMVAIGNRQAEEDAGIDDLAETAEEMLPSWRDQTDRSQRGFIAHRDGDIVGAAYLSTANDAEATSAEMGIMVESACWGVGVEQALLERVERVARDLGRTSVQSWTLHPATSNERMLTPATGWGSVAATALSDLLTANDYVLEQVERNSILPLDGPLTLAEEKLRAATAFAGDDYRVVSWTLPTPEHLRAGYADVISRMATDVPSGDLDIDAEVWDADRVVRHDKNIADGGQLLSVAAVEHVSTGRLVAFNELVIGSDRTGVTHQFGTLVVKEHRGKRLGTIVKCANLLRWREIAPDSPRISTFNAEENRPMLDINEAIGFVPASFAGGWQKKLA
ncbi:GNAT family N-acetyltransferase [Microbacterium murale]|uniref:N-acetyltransferase n=1 Tax=Microbacterium murale TaxID=1081040 RepID=A0ABQ1RVL5_9MICO|nr:GNAT family N-acetyltransferase [Microbacterium murale]GGD79545.1 N-acetyltransferase [Microbacterium murale]